MNGLAGGSPYSAGRGAHQRNGRRAVPTQHDRCQQGGNGSAAGLGWQGKYSNPRDHVGEAAAQLGQTGGRPRILVHSGVIRKVDGRLPGKNFDAFAKRMSRRKVNAPMLARPCNAKPAASSQTTAPSCGWPNNAAAAGASSARANAHMLLKNRVTAMRYRTRLMLNIRQYIRGAGLAARHLLRLILSSNHLFAPMNALVHDLIGCNVRRPLAAPATPFYACDHPWLTGRVERRSQHRVDLRRVALD